MHAKVPGTSFSRGAGENWISIMETSFGKASPEAYERLLLDAMIGRRHAFFARRDEVEEAWGNSWMRSKNAWACEKRTRLIYIFIPAGSWGPDEADELLARRRPRSGEDSERQNACSRRHTYSLGSPVEIGKIAKELKKAVDSGGRRDDASFADEPCGFIAKNEGR